MRRGSIASLIASARSEVSSEEGTRPAAATSLPRRSQPQPSVDGLEASHASLAMPSRPFTPRGDERHLIASRSVSGSSNNNSNNSNTNANSAAGHPPPTTASYSRPASSVGVRNPQNRPSTAFSVHQDFFTDAPTPRPLLQQQQQQQRETYVPKGIPRPPRAGGQTSSSSATPTTTATTAAAASASLQEPDSIAQIQEKQLPAKSWTAANQKEGSHDEPPAAEEEEEEEQQQQQRRRRQLQHGRELETESHSADWPRIAAALQAERASGDPLLFCDRINALIAPDTPLLPHEVETIVAKVGGLVKTNNPEVWARIVRLFLRVGVSGQQLVQTTKLAYKLSKESANDGLFASLGLVDLLMGMLVASPDSGGGDGGGRGAPGSSAPAHSAASPDLFALGCLKNCTVSCEKNQETLIAHGHLARLVSILSESDAARNADAVEQALGILRNMLGSSQALHQFAVFGALEIVVDVLGRWCALGSASICLDCVRILSKCSSDPECRYALENKAAVGSMLDALRKYPQYTSLVARAAYALCNLTSVASGVGRELVLRACPRGLEDLLDTFAALRGSTPTAKAAENLECACRLVRVLANLCVDADCRRKLTADHADYSSMLLSTMQQLRRLPGDQSGRWVEEALLSVTYALHNVSFELLPVVLDTQPAGRLGELLAELDRLLDSLNPEIAELCCGIVSNTARHADAAAFRKEAALLVTEKCVWMLNNQHLNVCRGVAGVLGNYVACEEFEYDRSGFKHRFEEMHVLEECVSIIERLVSMLDGIEQQQQQEEEEEEEEEEEQQEKNEKVPAKTDRSSDDSESAEAAGWMDDDDDDDRHREMDLDDQIQEMDQTLLVMLKLVHNLCAKNVCMSEDAVVRLYRVLMHPNVKDASLSQQILGFIRPRVLEELP